MTGGPAKSPNSLGHIPEASESMASLDDVQGMQERGGLVGKGLMEAARLARLEQRNAELALRQGLGQGDRLLRVDLGP